MAIDKAVDSGVLDTALTYTAERIRAKTGSADQIAWDAAKGFGDAVDGIQAGSGSPADIPNVGSVERLTFTPTENTQSVEVPFNKTFDSFYVVAYCSDITGSGDVSRIKQFAGQKLPFSGAYTGRIDVINDDGTADYWSQTRTTMTGTTIKFETSRPSYFEAGKTYNAEIFEVTV